MPMFAMARHVEPMLRLSSGCASIMQMSSNVMLRIYSFFQHMGTHSMDISQYCVAVRSPVCESKK